MLCAAHVRGERRAVAPARDHQHLSRGRGPSARPGGRRSRRRRRRGAAGAEAATSRSDWSAATRSRDIETYTSGTYRALLTPMLLRMLAIATCSPGRRGVGPAPGRFLSGRGGARGGGGRRGAGRRRTRRHAQTRATRRRFPAAADLRALVREIDRHYGGRAQVAVTRGGRVAAASSSGPHHAAVPDVERRQGGDGGRAARARRKSAGRTCGARSRTHWWARATVRSAS